MRYEASLGDSLPHQVHGSISKFDKQLNQVHRPDDENLSKSVFENSFPGSTGDSPVPSGDSPDGTRTTIQIEGDALFARVRSTVTVGGSPTEAGESPALPFFQTGSMRFIRPQTK